MAVTLHSSSAVAHLLALPLPGAPHVLPKPREYDGPRTTYEARTASDASPVTDDLPVAWTLRAEASRAKTAPQSSSLHVHSSLGSLRWLLPTLGAR